MDACLCRAALSSAWKAAGDGGYFLNTISRGGVLSQVGSPPIRPPSTPRGASRRNLDDFAQGRRHQGFILCPQGVDTNMTARDPEGRSSRR